MGRKFYEDFKYSKILSKSLTSYHKFLDLLDLSDAEVEEWIPDTDEEWAVTDEEDDPEPNHQERRKTWTCIRNERVEKLIEWCQTNILVGNTWFQQPPRRKWTWKSPGDETRNQIDYMMISKRYRNALLLAKTYPSADCYSDHVPVVGKFKLKLKKICKPFTNIKFDLAILKTNQTIREKYQISVQNKFEALGDAEEVEQQWENFKSAIMEAATEVIPKVKTKAKQKWMTEEILNLMEERRCAKGNKEKYEQIHKKVQEKCNMSKENWINEKCKEIEQQRKHTPQTMYRNIEEITGKITFLSTGCIKAMNGDIIIDKEKKS
ncbi:craniofacial development protein 2-like [Plakobranchus ocellatus]|uniref:Craniofacial development protein 2-like n=1 Tax=Plakobranchus ocellatus TaxID=259542 RepID=A0AAV4B7G8_9GAST|nr:craniofacial development protein 2-like [Plakobranchus ocellatus]